MYTRLGNPTISALEGKIAILQHAEDCAAASTSNGAIVATVWTIFIVQEQLSYGKKKQQTHKVRQSSHGLFQEHLTKFHVEVDFINASIPGEIKKHLKPNTKLVYFETPDNQTMKMINIEHAAEEEQRLFAITQCAP